MNREEAALRREAATDGNLRDLNLTAIRIVTVLLWAIGRQDQALEQQRALPTRTELWVSLSVVLLVGVGVGVGVGVAGFAVVLEVLAAWR